MKLILYHQSQLPNMHGTDPAWYSITSPGEIPPGSGMPVAKASNLSCSPNQKAGSIRTHSTGRKSKGCAEMKPLSISTTCWPFWYLSTCYQNGRWPGITKVMGGLYSRRTSSAPAEGTIFFGRSLHTYIHSKKGGPSTPGQDVKDKL